MRKWLSGRQATAPLIDANDDDDDNHHELHSLINTAYEHQCYIGWAHFFRGRISKKWKDAIAYYYKERQPGEPFNPTLWMRKTIDQMWKFFLTIWHCRNGELHGKDYEEARAIALSTTREEVKRIYEDSKDQVTTRESRILHTLPIEEILKWTKRHLDAYLATAEVILEQNVDPG